VSHGDGDPADENGSGEGSEGTEGREPDPQPAPDSDPAADADGRDSDVDAAAPDSDVDAARPRSDADTTDAVPDPAATGYAVPTDTGSDAETAWLRTLADAGELTPDAVESMLALHDDRGGRAIEAVSEGRVKQYQDFTVVVGHEDEYVVEDGGCTCKDTAYNLDPENPNDRCWHVLAVAIAERIGEVDHHEMWYSEVREFL
jgi:predicted nucleic acid-binding Zn finger protein